MCREAVSLRQGRVRREKAKEEYREVEKEGKEMECRKWREKTIDKVEIERGRVIRMGD